MCLEEFHAQLDKIKLLDNELVIMYLKDHPAETRFFEEFDESLTALKNTIASCLSDGGNVADVYEKHHVVELTTLPRIVKLVSRKYERYDNKYIALENYIGNIYSDLDNIEAWFHWNFSAFYDEDKDDI